MDVEPPVTDFHLSTAAVFFHVLIALHQNWMKAFCGLAAWSVFRSKGGGILIRVNTWDLLCCLVTAPATPALDGIELRTSVLLALV
jgi:hypothetical protein